MTKNKIKGVVQKYTMILILLLVVAFFAWRTGGKILMPQNITNIISQNAYVFVLAAGMLLCILTGGNIDLSVGSVAALTGLFTAKMMIVGVPVPLALIAGILIGTFFGFINGMLVNKTGLHPFIITLGTQSIFRGITLVLSNSRSVY